MSKGTIVLFILAATGLAVVGAMRVGPTTLAFVAGALCGAVITAPTAILVTALVVRSRQRPKEQVPFEQMRQRAHEPERQQSPVVIIAPQDATRYLPQPQQQQAWDLPLTRSAREFAIIGNDDD